MRKSDYFSSVFVLAFSLFSFYKIKQIMIISQLEIVRYFA